VYEVNLENGEGILDGGHTYTLIVQEQREAVAREPVVKFEIITRAPHEWVPEMAGGLNTSVQFRTCR